MLSMRNKCSFHQVWRDDSGLELKSTIIYPDGRGLPICRNLSARATSGVIKPLAVQYPPHETS